MDHVARGRIEDVLHGHAAQHLLADRADHVARLDHRLLRDADVGAAILHLDDAVLRHVHQAAGQVARVRRLERGVGQTLAGAVGRVEVLEHGQAFLEVRDDRRLDDLAGRLGHQAAHGGELAHLGRRATGARRGHHPDRVRLDLAAFLVELDGRDFLHHLVGDLVGALGPGVDDLVVFLALGDQAVLVLLFELGDLVARPVDDLPLLLGDDHVVLAERDAGLERLAEAERHDLVAEDDGFLLAAVAVDGVDQFADLALAERLVDQVERHVRVARQEVGDQHPAGRGHDALDDRGCRPRRPSPTGFRSGCGCRCRPAAARAPVRRHHGSTAGAAPAACRTSASRLPASEILAISSASTASSAAESFGSLSCFSSET